MYNELLNNFKTQMAPFTKAAEINKKAVETLVGLQQEVATEMFNRGVEQFKALSSVKEPQQALDLQVAFYKEMEAKLTGVAEQELAAINEARTEVTEIFEKSVSEMTENAMSEMSKFDLGQFDLSKFDMAQFDLTKMMPTFDAAKPAAKASRKPAAPKASA